MTLEIRNVHLADSDASLATELYTVRCAGGAIKEIIGQQSELDGRVVEGAPDVDVVDGNGGLIIPSLCHSHIHLDKCFILDQGPPLETGDFSEALRITAAAKSHFASDPEDLYQRGERLIRESVACGVTAMRAHVEVDGTVGPACLEAALRLKGEWKNACDVQIAVFMQDPLFEDANAPRMGANASHITAALDAFDGTPGKESSQISAVGSAPYVEPTRSQARENIRFILSLAMKHQLHADFHLDYDLTPLPATLNSLADVDTADPSTPLIYFLIGELKSRRWMDRAPGKVVTIGHATRLSLLAPEALRALSVIIEDLPVHFVGLPQSDLYMMGRDAAPGATPRGTLCVPRLRKYGLRVAMAVNNVGNAFTPQGAPDPLSLCPLGVAVYQDATQEGCRALLEAISTTSRLAIGLETSQRLSLSCGDPADLLILHDNESIVSAALGPAFTRTVIKGGKVVSWRKSQLWNVNSRDNGPASI